MHSRALTAGCERLQWAAEQVQAMRMNRPDLAILHCRRTAFSDRYDGLPLSPIEKDMADVGRNAMVVLFTYETVKASIERELAAMRRAAQPEFIGPRRP